MPRHQSDELLQRTLRLERQLAYIHRQNAQFRNDCLSKEESEKRPQSNTLPDPFIWNPNEDLSHQVAHNITAVVGLKEAILWENKVLKWVWGISLVLGVIATGWLIWESAAEYYSDPTATKVALAPQVAYAYPPLIICPDAWLDADKALSLGFTIDAIKYSFGYYDFSERLDIANITAAKEEFTSAYEKQNFSSLDEYLKAIAVDIAVADTIDYYAKSTKPSSWCEACLEKSSLQKIFFNGGICYVVRMAPEDGMGARRTVGGRFFSAMLGDRTRGLLQVTSLWRLSVIRDTNATIKRPTSPPMYLSHSAWHYVTVASERYFMLKNGAVSCVNRDEIGPEYSTETCYAECTNKIYDRNFKCHWFKDEPVFTRTIHQHHGNYCNFYDLPATRYFDRIQAAMIQNQAIVKSPDHAVCVRKCPYECERVKFSLTAKAHIDEANLPVDQQAMCEKARSLNMTGFAVQMMNEDFYQGGVLTLTEVTTMTLPGLISSFGGALGLFVGGTMMTFVQIVLFVVRYLMDRASSKSVVQPTQATSDMVYSVSYF